MRPSAWHPPVEASFLEQTIIAHIKRAKLFVFLRHHRHEIFDDAFQEELAALYPPSLRGHPPIAPAQLALATILQAYTGVSDDEVIEMTLMDRRWQLVLDCPDTEQAPFSKGTFVAFRKRLIDSQMDRRLIERTIEVASQTQEFGLRALRAALDSSPLWGAGRVEDTINLLGHALKKLMGAVAEQRGRALIEVGHEAGADVVCGTSLADGYDAQFCVQAERQIEHVPTGKYVAIDVGLKAFYTDSGGVTVRNPRHYRKAEKRLKRLQRRLSKKQKKSANRKKARQAVAKTHLKVQRQREDFARKQANALVSSHDFIAFEDLQIGNLVRNRHLAKSIHDVGWRRFLLWVTASASLHDIPVVAVPPQYTSQNCSACGALVKKSLSVRTHICTRCGIVLDRDHNAARNIVQKALSTVGQTGTDAPVSA